MLCNCRVDLRGVGRLNKNRDAVISLVFLENVAFYNADNVFYLPQNLTGDENEWSTRWSYTYAGDNDIAVKLDSA